MQLWDIVRNIRPVEGGETMHILRESGNSGNPIRWIPGLSALSGELSITEASRLLRLAVMQSEQQPDGRQQTERRQSSQMSGALNIPETIPVCSADGESVGEVRPEDFSFFRKHLEEGFIEDILNDLDNGIIAADEEGRIFYANQVYEELLGVPVRKVVGRNIFRIEPDSDLCEAIRNKEPMVNPRKYIHSVDRYVALKIHLLSKNGKFAGAVSIFTDVSELESLNSEIRRMSGMMEEFRQQLEENYQRTGVLTRDRSFLRLLDQATVAAGTDVPILIRGENGVGKEVVARYIHRASERSDQPLVTVNCASIPETLIESELFGYEEGSFTGAKRGGKMGKFELANHGTIFLDEIGDMPVALQSRLLRVIQNGEIEKIGRQKTVPVDVRIIAATNQPLEEMIGQKKFRQDLFYRLNVISFRIPPLRERREDIPLLAEHFLQEYTKKYGSVRRITDRGYRNLTAHDWSGNVRELQNCIERAVILSAEETLEFSEFAQEAAKNPEVTKTGSKRQGEVSVSPHWPVNPESEWQAAEGGLKGGLEDSREDDPDADLRRMMEGEDFSLSAALADYEKRMIRQALHASGGNREQAIRLLGLSRRTFYRKCAQYDISSGVPEMA